MVDKKLSVGSVVLKILSIGIAILITLLVVYALFGVGRNAYNFGYRVFTEESVDTIENGEDKVVQITEDMDGHAVGELLEKKGLVRDADLFFVQLKLSAYAKKIKEGTYTLSTSMTAKEMMQVMSAEEVEDTETEELKLMIVDERLVTYINSLDAGNLEYLEKLERKAIEDYVPIIRKETQQYLKVLLAMQKPKRILEVGTAVGFSALLMAEYNPVSCEIVTIENYEKRIPIAKQNFKNAGKDGQITLLEGDAMEILPTLTEPFDLIFMDAAKGQYINFLPEVLRLLKTGGTLVSDNVLQDGDIIESRFAVTRRNRTIHKRMREYLYELTHHRELVTTVLPIGDGLTISSKVEEK